MDLLDIWNYELSHGFILDLNDAELGLTADHTDFVVVDGEEGDHGVIRYLDATGELVATKTVHGGDSESLELTPYGKKFVAGHFRSIFDKLLLRKLEA